MRLTRRGKVVATIATVIVLYGLYFLVSHIWFVGDGYCWGTMEKCVGL
jgi:hypothetical protein